MSGKLWHGSALDQAMNPAEPNGPEGMGVCVSALDSRTKAVVDGQLQDFGPGGEFFASTKKMLMDEGLPFDDDAVMGLNLRSAIGAAFTYGIATGLRLAELPQSDDAPEAGV